MKTSRPEMNELVHGSIEHRALLWDAINQYVEACGGKPHEFVYGNTRRQRAVVEVEELVYPQNSKNNLPPAR